MPRETFGALSLIPKRVHRQWDENEIKHHFKTKCNNTYIKNNEFFSCEDHSIRFKTSDMWNVTENYLPARPTYIIIKYAFIVKYISYAIGLIL